jgi:hypothetical protein
MKWTLKLVTESDSGETKVQDVAEWERKDKSAKPAHLGLTIEENKQIAASIQTRMGEGGGGVVENLTYLR